MRLLAALSLLWVGLAHAGPTSLGPNYDVKADVAETCAACHGLRYLDLAQGYDTPAEWSHLIASMVKLPPERDRPSNTSPKTIGISLKKHRYWYKATRTSLSRSGLHPFGSAHARSGGVTRRRYLVDRYGPLSL